MLVIGALWMLAGCGGGGSSSSNTCQNMMGSGACASCLQAKCDSQNQACLGSDYKNGNFSGPCGPLVACTCKCASSDVQCLSGCYGKNTPACMTCSQASTACTQQNCSTECGTAQGTGTADMAMPLSANCAALAACCAQPTFPAAQQAGCSMTSVLSDMECAGAVTGYKALGYCS
jgi:hypothetical protein